MKQNVIILLAFLSCLTAFADTPPPGTVKLKGGTDGTVIGNSGDSLKVSATIGLPTNAAQETGGHLASMDTKLSTINTSLGSPFQVGGSIGNSAFGISGTLPAFATTPTFNLGTLNGAATNATLVTINSTLGSPFQSGGSIGNTSFGISGTLPAYGSTPTFNLGTLNGAATAVKQPALGTAGTASADVITVQGVTGMTPLSTKAPLNTTGSGSAAAASVSTVSTLTAPANAVGFILMNLDTSTTNMRWAVGRTASTTLGQQLQPGRDTGFVPVGANISIIAESGTVTYDVQWVSQ